MSDQTWLHETVLLHDAVACLVKDPAGVYVDATFGRGGHSAAILSALNEKGRLIALDKDHEAIQKAKVIFGNEPRFEVIHGSFAGIEAHLTQKDLQCVDGVLADLGVSSPQLDDADRGFSFLKDGPLDMRMDRSQGQSASEWLRSSSVDEIAQVLKEYGEEKFSRRIAGAIYEAFQSGPIESTLALAKIVAEANPAWEKHKHPATRTFQAIRIKVNNELGDLESMLQGASRVLKPGGRLVVISFHSLEDRMVKQFMRNKSKGNTPPVNIPMFEKDIVRHFKLVGKAIKPSEKEVTNNVRARSAVMRVLEKVTHE